MSHEHDEPTAAQDGAMRPDRPGDRPGERRPDRREVATALARSPHRIEIVDHGLAIPGRRPADLVGVDGDGRLVLVLLGSGGPEDALDALHALAFARRRGAQLAEHLGRTLERPGPRARVVLVAAAATRELEGLLAPLEPAGIELYETSVLESHRGTRTFVAPTNDGASEEPAARPVARRAEPALREIPEEAEELHAGRDLEGDELLEDLVRRIERLDEAIESHGAGGSVRWELDGRPLCSIALDRDPARGALPGADGTYDDEEESDVVELADPAAAEAFLGRVLERFLELTGAGPSLEGTLGRAGRLGATQLLTAEEIEAFRDPL